MEIAFDAIGIEITNETAFNNLAEDVEKRGEASRLTRKTGVLHGHCLKLGAGLEIWTVLYETGAGIVSYADCRPAFRARFSQKISPWLLTETDAEGKALVHGFVEGFDTEVLFELQNLTEIGSEIYKRNSLQISLCGLAHTAEIRTKAEPFYWKSYDEIALNVVADENSWSLCGRIIDFETLRNPFSGTDLYWLHLDLGELKLEILVNRRLVGSKKPAIGKFIRAEIWLQGHVVVEILKRSGYEGVDRSARTIDFWKQFKKVN